MKKTMRKIMIVFVAALMVMMMAVPSFAVTYPLSTTVYFYAQGGNVTQYGGDIISVPAINTGAQVTYQTGFTTNFTTAFPTPSGVTHQYEDVQPTVMDAIYDVYYYLNNYSNNGITIGWDGSSTPNGAYLYQLNGVSQIPEIIQSNYWKGYSWHIFLNQVTNSWNGTTRKGLIPYYASNMPLQDGDKVYVRFLESEQSW